MNKEEDLDIVLLPGEHVVYKTRRGFARLPFSVWAVATNKRFLLAKKLGFVASYKSIFYNSISQVSVRKGALGSKLVIALSNVREKSEIRFAKKLQALSIFSVLSNQISMKGDISMLYQGIGDRKSRDSNYNSTSESAGPGRISEVVEEIEANSVMFAEMMKRMEGNAAEKRPNFKSFIRRVEGESGAYTKGAEKGEKGAAAQRPSASSIEHAAIPVRGIDSIGIPGMNSSSTIALPYTSAILQTPASAQIEHKVNNTWSILGGTINALPKVENASVNEGVMPYTERSGRLNPDKDMIIFKRRSIRNRLFSQE
ncbi:MAG: PH domain-containing protein [Candidatus Micrarchaeaceae archaeon]